MSQSNAYKKVEKPRASNQVEILKNEIRITAQGRSRSYISYAVSLLDQSLLQKDETVEVVEQQQFDAVVLKAMGKAIQKAVTIAEVLKRRVAGLHQITSIESQEIEDQYEPKEEGMDIVIKKRTVSSIIIKLSKKQLDTNDLGYQVPIPLDQVTAPQIITSSMQKRGIVPGNASSTPANNSGAIPTESGLGKRRRRRRTGASRGGRVATTTTTAAATTTTTTEKPTRTNATGERQTRVRAPRVRNNAVPSTEGGSAAVATTEGGDAPTTQSSRGRGRGRGNRGSRGGRGRGSGRGRGQPRNGGGDASTTQQE